VEVGCNEFAAQGHRLALLRPIVNSYLSSYCMTANWANTCTLVCVP